jgi:hypothetical protein
MSWMMRHVRSAVLLASICANSSAFAADRAVTLTVPPPAQKDIAAMPQIADPTDDAERRINAALKQLDRKVLGAAKDCQGGDWQRTVEAPMRGPGFLSLTVTDAVFCAGNAHPSSSTFSIVYDLATGRPVDWTKLLPASLTGTVALEEQADGSKIVTLAAKRLFDLYMGGYGAVAAGRSDLDDCKQALLATATDAPPGMMVWLDAKAGGLAVQVGLPHAVAACEEPVVIPTATLRKEGAQAALLKPFDATPRK